jgi:hypothetical protein
MRIKNQLEHEFFFEIFKIRIFKSQFCLLNTMCILTMYRYSLKNSNFLKT